MEKIMNHHLPHAVGTFMLLLAIVACVLPGQAGQPQPAPTLDPGAVESAIAGTAQAAALQTQQANPPTATDTAVPTATITSTPKISNAGTSLVYLADGSTQFIDHIAGMQMVFPAGWLVVRTGEEEYYAAWGRKEAANAEFQEIFTAMQGADPRSFRLNALDLRPEHMPNGQILRVEVVFLEGDPRTLDEIKKNETNNPPPLTGYKLLSAGPLENSLGIQALSMEIQWTIGDGTKMGYRKAVYFKVPGGNMAVSLVISLDQKETGLSEFDQILGSITLFNP